MLHRQTYLRGSKATHMERGCLWEIEVDRQTGAWPVKKMHALATGTLTCMIASARSCGLHHQLIYCARYYKGCWSNKSRSLFCISHILHLQLAGGSRIICIETLHAGTTSSSNTTWIERLTDSCFASATLCSCSASLHANLQSIRPRGMCDVELGYCSSRIRCMQSLHADSA